MQNGNHVRIDRTKPLSQDPNTGHNRWHPEIKPIQFVSPGDVLTLDTRDALDGIITPATKAEELGHLEMGRIHPLTGPVYVDGAEPGDVLEIEILEIRPEPFGFTLLIPGFGILRDYYPKPYIVKWNIAGSVATSHELPGVEIPGAPFMGVMGVAPSHDLLRAIEHRESDLHSRGGAVILPSPEGAIPASEPIATKGLRTIPPRENGGNIDIRHLTAGSKLYLPVFVRGALFSAGDAHFAQGDCESCGTAIEIGATVRLKFGVLKGANRSHITRSLSFGNGGRGPKLAAEGGYYATTGLPITSDGRNESEDTTLAAKNALLNMIDYLVQEHGFSREQAYVLTSVAVDIHVCEMVDIPNVLVSAFLPRDIFK